MPRKRWQQLPEHRGKRHRGDRADFGDAFTASLVFLVGTVICAFLFVANPFLHPFEAYNLVNTAVLIWIPLVVIILFLGREPEEFGMSPGERKVGWRWALGCWLLMVPLVAWAASRTEFRHYYMGALSQPLANFFNSSHSIFLYDYYAYSPILLPHVHPLGLVYYELVMGFYFFCWEFFFRGFLLFGLAKFRGLGDWGAVFVQAVPFALLHYSTVAGASKPLLEIVSAFFGGVILGALALRTRSFAYGFIIHWAIAVTLDLIILWPAINSGL